MSFSYSISPRQTAKKGTVYDARFRVVDGSGKEVQKRLCGFKTKAEAKRAAVKFLSTYVPPAPPVQPLVLGEKITFEKALDAFLAFDKLQTKDVTLYEKRRLFALHITPYFRGFDIRSIDKRAIAAWQQELWAKSYSLKYTERVNYTCKGFFKWCAERYDINNPFQNLSAPKRRESKKPLEFYELDEFVELERSMSDSILWHTLFGFLFYTGCRVGELQALSESDLSKKGVTINKTYTKKTTDGSPYNITETKNYKVRTVPIPTHLQSLLKEYLVWKRSNNIATDFLFGGDRPVALQTIRNYLDKYTALSGVKRIRIHGFRHSYVSLCAHIGASPLVIAGLIGDTPTTVMQVYAHIWAEDSTAVVRKIDDLCANFVP